MDACRATGNAVEFGGWQGSSTERIARRFATVLVVDAWQLGEEFLPAAAAYAVFCDRMAHRPNVARFRAWAHEFMPVYDGPLAFLHVDHDHGYDATRDAIRWGLDRALPGAVLAGHDYGHPDYPGVAGAVDELLPGRTVEGVVWWQRV